MDVTHCFVLVSSLGGKMFQIFKKGFNLKFNIKFTIFATSPMRMGAWSMACVLRQWIENYTS